MSLLNARNWVSQLILSQLPALGESQVQAYSSYSKGVDLAEYGGEHSVKSLHQKILLALILVFFFMVLQPLLVYASPKVKIIAVIQSTSWVDTGIKAIIFPDHHGWILHSQAGNTPKVKPVQLSSGEFDALSNCFDQNYFLELPENIRTNRTDGSSIDVYLATNDQFKFIESYMSDNIVFNKLSKTLISTLEKQKSKEVPFTAFINDCKKCVQTYQKDSPEFQCTEKFLRDLYFEYSAYGKAKEAVKSQFVSILGETVEGLQEKHLQEKNAKYDREEALNKQAPNAENLIAQSGELLSGAQKITAGAPLKGQSSTPQVDLQNLSQWWKRSSELSSLLMANSRYVNNLRSVTSKTLNFCTVQELLTHASSWLNKSVEYTMAGDNKNARLYQKAASMAVVAATEVAAGRFPASMSLSKSSDGTSLGECKYTYHYEDKGGKFVPVKNKIDPNGFESVRQVLVIPSFLPKSN